MTATAKSRRAGGPAFAHQVCQVGERDFDTLQPSLPVEAYEGLFLVAAGDSVDQVLRARETRVDRPIDTTDFSESLETPESQARFVVVDGEDELTAIMNAPLAQWRVFLHPTQRTLATGDRSGPVRVLGGAGTGKTVLAMHRAKWLAENRTPEGKKVLFTTFTRNLAFDLEENLDSFCPTDTIKKIEVRNLDSWVHVFLRAQKYEHKIVYNRKKDAEEAWQRALALKDSTLGLPDSFYEEELDQVILAHRPVPPPGPAPTGPTSARGRSPPRTAKARPRRPWPATAPAHRRPRPPPGR